VSNKQQAVQGEDKDGRRDFLFVFIDIVNFTRLTDTGQLNTLIQKFYELVAGALRGNDSGLEQWLSTGDGGIAVFQAEKEDEGVNFAATLSKLANQKELRVPVQMLNQGGEMEDSVQKFDLRIGISRGYAVQSEVFHRPSYISASLNLCQRIMDIGEENHVLLPQTQGERLRESGRLPYKFLDLDQIYYDKHGNQLRVSSLIAPQDHAIGNPRPPSPMTRIKVFSPIAPDAENQFIGWLNNLGDTLFSRRLTPKLANESYQGLVKATFALFFFNLRKLVNTETNSIRVTGYSEIVSRCFELCRSCTKSKFYGVSLMPTQLWMGDDPLLGKILDEQESLKQAARAQAEFFRILIKNPRIDTDAGTLQRFKVRHEKKLGRPLSILDGKYPDREGYKDFVIFKFWFSDQRHEDPDFQLVIESIFYNNLAGVPFQDYNQFKTTYDAIRDSLAAEIIFDDAIANTYFEDWKRWEERASTPR